MFLLLHLLGDLHTDYLLQLHGKKEAQEAQEA
jgi:hypothetical protein